jgi:hypothetical protein
MSNNNQKSYKFDQTSFAQLRSKLNKLDDNLLSIFGLVHLGECELSDCNRHLNYSLSQIQSILDDFERTQFPYIGK